MTYNDNALFDCLTHNYKMNKLLLQAVFITTALAFTFLYPSVNPESIIINAVTNYVFYVTRSYDINANPTPYDTQLVPANSLIVITFPSQYNLTAHIPTVADLYIDGNIVANYSQTVQLNNLTISSAIKTSLPISNIYISVTNVLNPHPALTTGPFVISVGNDQSANSSSSAITLIAASFVSCSITFKPSFVNTTSAMVVSLTPRNPLYLNDQIEIGFPPTLQWSQDISTAHALPIGSTLTCTPLTGLITSGECVGQVSTALITFTITSINGSSVAEAFSFEISTLFSPPTTSPPDTLLITSLSNSYDVDTCTSGITGLQPQTLPFTLSASLQPLYINSATALVLNFTLTDTVSKTDYFQFVLPAGSQFTFLIISTTNLIIFPTSVTYVSSNRTLVMRQPISSLTKYAGAVCSITLSKYVAPPSALTASPFLFQVYDQSNGLKMQGTASLSAQPKSYTLAVQSDSYLINYHARYNFTLTVTDTVLSAGMIQIDIPAELTPSFNSSCLLYSNFSSPGLPVCTLTSSRTVTITNFSTSSTSTGVYTFTIGTIINAGQALTTSNFSLRLYYTNNTQTLMATSNVKGVTIQPKQLNLNTISVSLSDYHIHASDVTINITFIVADSVSLNGYITVTIPNEITQVSNYIPQCILYIGNQSTIPSCSIINSTFTLPIGAFTISSGQTIAVIISSFGINPSTTKPTSALSIQTQSSVHNIIDYSNSKTISGFLPLPLALSIKPTNPQNSALSPYLLTLQQTYSWESNSSLNLKLPPTVTLPNSTLNCFNNTNNQSLSCSSNTTVNPQSIDIYLSQSVSQAEIRIQNLNNPPSMQPSGTFSVITLSSEGYIYATDNSKTITTTKSSAFVSVSYKFSSQVYNTVTNLSILLIQHILTNKLTINPISQFINASTSYSCSSAIQIICTLSGTSLVITPANASEYFPIEENITIYNLFVPNSPSAMIARSYKNSYLVSEYDNINWQSLCEMPCLTCLDTNRTACLSCSTDSTLTIYHYLYQYQCYQSCPSGTFLPISTNQCLACKSPCSECVQSADHCTQCLQNSTTTILNTNTHTCLKDCPNGYYKNSLTSITVYTPVCTLCQLPCLTCTSATLCLSCANSSLFYHLNHCLSSCPENISIANFSLMICQPCSPNCATCINQTTTCTTCNLTVAPFFISSTSTCLSACPEPLVPEGSNCIPCQSPCATCDFVKTNCTSCLSGTNTYLSVLTKNSCINACQQFYFANKTSLQCQSCGSLPINCLNCYNETYCLSCDSGFVMFLSNHSCLLRVPSGYINISGIAIACTSNCSQCLGNTNNCTACESMLSLNVWLGVGQCVTDCPSTTLNISSICQKCTYPCLTCFNTLVNCTSCLTGYLWLNQCHLICPNGTFIEINASICQSCRSPCANCLSLMSCTTCSTGYLLNFSCIANCPSGTLTNNATNICQYCSFPCKTCSTQTSNCTSCLSNYYYFQTANDCYQSCPKDISIPDTSHFFCLSCATICLTCSISIDNCTSCSLGMSLYNQTCLNQCPKGYYEEGRICLPCTNNCSTCTLMSNYCLSCINPFNLYKSNCLLTCPVTHSIVVNNVCTACSNACLNCTQTDFCYQCPSNTALYEGKCLTSCPSPLVLYYNQTTNQLSCLTQSQINQQSNKETLSQSLQVNSILPLPFTIVVSFFFLCCLMSKLQNPDTYVTGIGYSLYGCGEAGAVAYLLYLYHKDYTSDSHFELYMLLIWVCIGIIMSLNFISFFMITPCICRDLQFTNWLGNKSRGTPQESEQKDQVTQKQTGNSSNEHQNSQCCSHNCSFTIFTLLSLIISYKLRMIIFTKLFRFKCLSAQLEDLHQFKIFNIMSYLGIFYQGLYCYIAIKLFSFHNFENDRQLMFAAIDGLLVIGTSFILSLISSQKQQTFFKIKQQNTNGIDLGKRKIKKDPKNFKINQKRLHDMDSRDKLIDLDEQISNAGEEEQEDIIVNHNIDSKIMPKKVSSSWVEREDKPSRSKFKEKNVFDMGEIEEQYELPFENQKYNISAWDRADLFHTSVQPSKSRLTESRATNFLPLERSRTKQQNVLESHLARKVNLQNKMQAPSQAELPINSKRQLGAAASIVNIDLDSVEAVQPISKQHLFQTRKAEIKMTDSEVFSPEVNQQGQNTKITNKLHPIIKETQSQNYNSQQIKGSILNSDKILQSGQKLKNSNEERIKKSSQKDVTADDLNKTFEEGELQLLRQKSFDSVLPFVHEDGILKDKIRKNENAQQIKKQQNNIFNAETPVVQRKSNSMAVVANSYFIENKDKNAEGEQQFQELLDLSQIPAISKKEKEEKITTEYAKTEQIPKNKSKITLVPTQLNQKIQPYRQQLDSKILSMPQASEKSRSRSQLMATQQFTQKVSPQQKRPIVHVPKTFSRPTLFPADPINESQEIDQFQLQIAQKASELQNLRAEVQNINNKAKIADLNMKSAQSNLSISNIKSKNLNNELIIKQNQSKWHEQPSKQSQQDLQELELQPKVNSRIIISQKSRKSKKNRSQTEINKNIFDHQIDTEPERQPSFSRQKHLNQESRSQQQSENIEQQDSDGKEERENIVEIISRNSKTYKKQQEQVEQNIQISNQLKKFQQKESISKSIRQSEGSIEEAQIVYHKQKSDIKSASIERKSLKKSERFKEQYSSKHLKSQQQSQQVSQKEDEEKQSGHRKTTEQLQNHQEEQNSDEQQQQIDQQEDQLNQKLPQKLSSHSNSKISQQNFKPQTQKQSQAASFNQIQPSSQPFALKQEQFQLQTYSKQSYHSQSQESDSNKINILYSKPNNRIFQQLEQKDSKEFENLQKAPAKLHPQFIAQEDQSNLSESYEKPQSKIELQIYQQSNESQSNPTQHHQQISRNNDKIAKEIPLSLPPPQEFQPQQQRSSPFLFSRPRFYETHAPAQDQDPAISRSKINSFVQGQQKPSSKQRKSEQNQKNSHQQVIDLLNKAGRRSREKKKMPKEEKDQRIVIKLEHKQIGKPRLTQNNNLVRKSLQKNKPISNYTLKKNNLSYSNEELQQPEKKYRQSTLLKNNTTSYLLSKQPERPSRIIRDTPTSNFELYQQKVDVPQLILNFPKAESRNEVRQFNFGEEISSDKSNPHFSSEAEIVKWQDNFKRENLVPSANRQSYYQPTNIPKQPIISKLTQLDQSYQEQDQIQAESHRPPSKVKRHRSKHRKNRSKNRKDELQKIYGL